MVSFFFLSKAAPKCRSVHLEGESPSSAITGFCPECDSEVDIPLSGVEWLTTDHLALDEVFLETLMSENSVVCDLCSDWDTEKRCEVCCVNLCEFCQAQRRQKRTSTHTVECLEDLKTQDRLSRPVLCSLHPVRSCVSSVRSATCPSAWSVPPPSTVTTTLVTGLLLSRLDRLEESLRKVDLSQEVLQARMDATADEVRSFARGYASAVESHCLSLLRCLVELRLQCRNQLHLQRAQLQQALSDARGGMAFTERLLMCGSDSENLSAKGVTLRRLVNLVETDYDPHPATIAPDNSSSICFLPRESAGKVGGYPVVEVIHAKTLELSRCTIEGEGETQTKAFMVLAASWCGYVFHRQGLGNRSLPSLVLVSMVHKEKKDRLEVAVVDNSDGSYSISYTPVEPGSYSVWDQPRVSPFVLNVKRKVQRHSGMFHCFSFCSSGGSKEARCGCTGTMPGGFRGCGHGHKGLPGKPHWLCCGSVVEASDCLPQSVITAVGGTGSGSPRGHLRTVQL
uniref:B box-type domain-containing protein n=1 Tax=Oncorhynchus tshawytscha TaxID=74940 RepID=A0A8C8CGA9_ONCTS